MKERRDLEIESFKPKDEPWIIMDYRIKGAVIEPKASVRLYEPPMQNDAFLNYLEWKLNKPWYDRIFLP